MPLILQSHFTFYHSYVTRYSASRLCFSPVITSSICERTITAWNDAQSTRITVAKIEKDVLCITPWPEKRFAKKHCIIIFQRWPNNNKKSFSRSNRKMQNWKNPLWFCLFLTWWKAKYIMKWPDEWGSSDPLWSMVLLERILVNVKDPRLPARLLTVPKWDFCGQDILQILL
jgi:hypothetical protein